MGGVGPLRRRCRALAPSGVQAAVWPIEAASSGNRHAAQQSGDARASARPCIIIIVFAQCASCNMAKRLAHHQHHRRAAAREYLSEINKSASSASAAAILPQQPVVAVGRNAGVLGGGWCAAFCHQSRADGMHPMAGHGITLSA